MFLNYREGHLHIWKWVTAYNKVLAMPFKNSSLLKCCQKANIPSFKFQQNLWHNFLKYTYFLCAVLHANTLIQILKNVLWKSSLKCLAAKITLEIQWNIKLSSTFYKSTSTTSKHLIYWISKVYFYKEYI